MTQSTGGTNSENSRPENMRNREKKCIWNKNLTCGLYIWLPRHCYPGKAPISKNKTKTNCLTPFTGKPLLRLRLNVLLMRNYHRQTDYAKHSLQASSPIGKVARAACERRCEYKRRTRYFPLCPRIRLDIKSTDFVVGKRLNTTNEVRFSIVMFFWQPLLSPLISRFIFSKLNGKIQPHSMFPSPSDRPSASQENQCLLTHFLTTLGAQEKSDCTSMLWPNMDNIHVSMDQLTLGTLSSVSRIV